MTDVNLALGLSLAQHLAAASPLVRLTQAPQRCRSLVLGHVDDQRLADRLAALATAVPHTALLVGGVAQYAPFLQRVMRREPEFLLACLEAPLDKVLDDLLREVRQAADHTPLPVAMARLRALRLRFALLVALADVAGFWSVDRVTEALSRFADAAVQTALALALKEAIQGGRLSAFDPLLDPAKSGITVLAMGKHGAGELNYSSDIDLIVLFDPSRLPVTAGREALETAVRIVKDMVRVLHEQTGGGYVFRTDLRLRPDPASTPIAVPIERAVVYYQTVGQNWERAALIKARAVAGDVALGESFLAELTPFIWRRYFDYAAIADIHAMKRQIHAHRGGEVIAIEGHDVKLGRGGIREIEFFVQTQQLVFGGRKPDLRGRGTLAMLAELASAGLITAEAQTDLTDAYRFLRMVEHRLQMEDDQQTQRMPRDAAAVDRLAGFCGMAPVAFRKALRGHFEAVERHYAQLFEDAPELSSGHGSLVFTGSSDDPETLKTLRRMGFTRPEAVAETVRGWHFGRRAGIVTARAREVLTELTPALLEALGQSSDPDGALLALDNALQRMPAVVELFTILRQNAPLRALFAEILGSAPRLSEVVVQRPHVLDALVDSDFTRPATGDALRQRFQERLGALLAMEDFLDQLRDLARAERFLVGARLFSQILTAQEAGGAHAEVAAASVDACLTRVLAEMTERHGTMTGARMAIVALGKFGSREMTALSDLDLMVIYDTDDAARESDGAKPITASEYHAKLTQRLVTALTVPTKRGGLYEVDLRLRPSGGKGPVAVSLDAFRDYHGAPDGGAETWERMALTRARPVAGDPVLGEEIRAVVARSRAVASGQKTTMADVRAMRALIHREKQALGRFDLKHASGGLVDIEFAAQALLLRFPDVAVSEAAPDPAVVLAQMAKQGRLAPDQAAVLQEAWLLQSTLAQWLALVQDQKIFRPEDASAAVKRKLAGAVGLPDFTVLSAALAEQQVRAKTVVDAVLAEA